MENHIANESQLLAEIEKLRPDFPHTQDLYREVCALLFFRYGVTPTANKLYQLVRKGSMSAPAEALNKFWADLREKSRVRIEHPDLPESLRTAAGELTATLWSTAQAAAAETLQTLRAEAQASVVAAKAAQEAAEKKLMSANETCESQRREIEVLKQDNSQFQQQLAAERALRESVEVQLQKAHADIADHLIAQESARRFFSDEMERLRTAAQLDKERFASAERRFLQDVDHERQAAARLQKELEQTSQEAVRVQDQHRKDIAALQSQLGDLRQQFGIIEGRLQSVTLDREILTLELKEVHAQQAESAARQNQLVIEADNWRQQSEKLESELVTLKAKLERTGKKAKSVEQRS